MSLPRPLRGLVESWSRKDFYAEAALRCRGAGLVYLLVVVALVQVVAVTVIAVAFQQWITREVPRFTGQIPAMTIDRGRLSTAVAMPYRLVDPKTGQAWAIVDTAGTLEELPREPGSVLVTSTEVIVRKSALETRVFQLAPVSHLVVDGPTVQRWIGTLSLFLPPFLYCVLVPFGWAWNLACAAVLALVGLLFARGRAPRLEFAAVMRIAAVALTPVILLDTLLAAVHARFPGWAVVSLGIGLAYTWFGVRAAQGAAAAGAGAAAPGAGTLSAETPAPEPAPAGPPSGDAPA